jgi:hypothetical protein
MRLQVVKGKRRNEEFLAKQRTMLQMQKWASPGAPLELATNGCYCHILHISDVRDFV